VPHGDGVAVLKLAGIVLLVVLILVGALMPLKYTARLQLPKPGPQARGAARSQPGDRDD
jgi:energy-converting hydrogenase Eha subunit F